MTKTLRTRLLSEIARDPGTLNPGTSWYGLAAIFKPEMSDAEVLTRARHEVEWRIDAARSDEEMVQQLRDEAARLAAAMAVVTETGDSA